MDNPEEAIQGPATLTLVVHPTVDDRVLVFRSVDDYATHWMDSRGVWIGLPQPEEMEQLLDWLTDTPDMLPILNAEVYEGMKGTDDD